MIIVHLGELEEESGRLYAFIKSKTQTPIMIKGNVIILNSGREQPSPRDVKAFVKRFLYHRGLSKNYRVTEEHGTIRITQLKHRKKRWVKKKGTPPPPYDTLPYYFPVHQ